MVKTEEMIDFVEKVMEMRRVQKEFFKTRNYAAMQLSNPFQEILKAALPHNFLS